jgi:hypothetical protein
MFVLFDHSTCYEYEKVLRIPVPGSYRVCCYHCLPLGKCNSLVITFTDTPVIIYCCRDTYISFVIAASLKQTNSLELYQHRNGRSGCVTYPPVPVWH